MHSFCFNKYIFFFYFLILSFSLSADSIILKDGTEIDGTIIDQTPNNITIKTSFLHITIGKDKIQNIQSSLSVDYEASKPEPFRKTTFELAEEMYHNGKIIKALGYYKKVVEKEPQNKEASQRITEINKKMSEKLKKNQLPSIRPIQPISEQEVIILAMTRDFKSSSKPVQNPPLRTNQNTLNSLSKSNSPFAIPNQSSVSQSELNPSPSGKTQGMIGLPPLQPSLVQNQSSPFKAPSKQVPSLAPFSQSDQATPIQPQTRGPFAPPTGTMSEQGQSSQMPPLAPFPKSGQIKPDFSSSYPQPLPPIGTYSQAKGNSSQERNGSMQGSRSPLIQKAFPQEAVQTTPLPPFQIPQETAKPPFFIAQSQTKLPQSPEQPEFFNKVKETPAQTQSEVPIPAEEFRGVWISRFEWPAKDQVSCKEKILRYLDNAALNNFNAVVFQIRGQGDVLYPSPFEPWSHLIGGKDPGFDPLQFTLEEAHSRNLEFHAYINVYPVWQGTKPPDHSEPEHPFWLYCQKDSDPCLVCFHKSGEIMKPDKRENDNYYYFSPGIPAVNAYIRKIIMDLVQRYDIDGIHFDRIRYPGMNYSYDEVSKGRFDGEGNPDGLSWIDWQCDQITRFLNDVYGEIASIKPNMKISVAGWGIYNKDRYPGYSGFSSGYHQYYQDTFAWMKKGVIDALMPMIYWDIDNPKPNYDELARDFLNNSHGRHVYCANWCNQLNMPKEEFLAQINFTRQMNSKGNIAFSIGGLERRKLYSFYKEQIYPKPASIPDMPWKTNPSKGIIIGKVVNKQNGEPITDAQINMNGREETWLSSSDGFFAILHIEPGSEYQLTVTKNNFGQYTTPPLQVEAGKILQVDIPLGG